jgi:hypothetical protein
MNHVHTDTEDFKEEVFGRRFGRGLILNAWFWGAELNIPNYSVKSRDVCKPYLLNILDCVPEALKSQFHEGKGYDF